MARAYQPLQLWKLDSGGLQSNGSVHSRRHIPEPQPPRTVRTPSPCCPAQGCRLLPGPPEGPPTGPRATRGVEQQLHAPQRSSSSWGRGSKNASSTRPCRNPSWRRGLGSSGTSRAERCVFASWKLMQRGEGLDGPGAGGVIRMGVRRPKLPIKVDEWIFP